MNNEDYFDGNYHTEHDDEEYLDASIQSMREWWEQHMPTTLISIVDPVKYAIAQKSIDTIIDTINAIPDEDERPKYEVSYQILGTVLELKLKLDEYAITINASDLRRIVSTLPEDSEISILPQSNYKASIFIFFKNIKVIL